VFDQVSVTDILSSQNTKNGGLLGCWTRARRRLEAGTKRFPSSIPTGRGACRTRRKVIVDELARGRVKREASRGDGTELNQVDYQTGVHDRKRYRLYKGQETRS
jgi:hypothetical protein